MAEPTEQTVAPSAALVRARPGNALLPHQAPPPLAGSEARVVHDEKALIGQTRAGRVGGDGPLPWCGLGLSGGGIRSASLCLGVLQALAERDLLKRFDYLSSVSGGGYIATSLQWWWTKPREDRPDPLNPELTFGVGPDDFPYGPAQPPQQAPGAVKQRAMRNLAFLRAHSSYLTPGGGISLWSILGVLLRTVSISLLTWIPILTFFFLVVTFVNGYANTLAQWLNLGSPLGPYATPQWLPSNCRELDCALQYPAIYAFTLDAFYLICFVFVGAALLFAFVSRAPQDSRGRFRTIIVHGAGASLALAVLYFIAVEYSSLDLLTLLIAIVVTIYLFVAILIVASELITTKSLNASYWVRRSIEWLMGKVFLPSLALLAVSTIPLVPSFVTQYASTKHLTLAASIVGLAGGVGSSLYGYYTFLRNIVPGLVGQIAATAGSIAYLYATLVVAYLLAICLVDYRFLPIDWSKWLYDGLVTSIVIAFAIGFIANVNYVGFHRFYRDRLMETFMPTDASVSSSKVNYSPVADNLSIANLRESFAPPTEFQKAHPYPLINTNAILVKDDDQIVASRGGDSFVVSPLYIGSRATGWQDMQEYVDRNGPFTLASAMAASGAAANASAGYIGTGITMNPFVSSVMSLLNIRLGLWVGNPYHKDSRSIRTIPTFLMAGIFPGIIGALHRHDSSFLELTDGGHFENLGLYELVRRKLDVIVVVDGEEDPNISLSSLVSAARRIEQDFSARLCLVDNLGPERLVMYPAEKGYPLNVRYAEAPFLVGEVKYDDGTSGTLIYIKATIVKNIDFTIAGYLAANPTFPHQTTANQFFNPDQFDAYRLLGYESAVRMIDELRLPTTIARPATILETYNDAARPDNQIT